MLVESNPGKVLRWQIVEDSKGRTKASSVFVQWRRITAFGKDMVDMVNFEMF